MNLWKSFLIVLSLGLIGAAFSRCAMASEDNERTIFTFNEPVGIPGTVLSPGTYVFELLEPETDRSVVQIFNRDQNKLVATLLTVSDHRMKPTGKAVITFENRAPNSPEAIKAWFYPGETNGQEFVYPESKTVVLASHTNKTAHSTPGR